MAGCLGLVVAVALAADDAPDWLWVTVLVALVLVAGGAVVVAMLSRTPDQPMKRVWRVTLAWMALTIVSLPFAYGAPLILTLPGLSALFARLYVGPSNVPGRTIACVVLGPAVLVGVIWLVLRVDEVPTEAIPSVAIAFVGALGLTQLRRQSRRHTSA